MKRAIMLATVSLISLGLVLSVPGQAAPKKIPGKKLNQIVSMLQQIQQQQVVPQAIDGKPGSQEEKGGKGDSGLKGDPGLSGANGKDGKPGENGRDGANGKDGISLPSGTTILIKGTCPDGFTVDGQENVWAVYNSKIIDKPWNNSNAWQVLNFSACKIN
jgi:hypothetical protein